MKLQAGYGQFFYKVQKRIGKTFKHHCRFPPYNFEYINNLPHICKFVKSFVNIFIKNFHF